MARKSRTKLGMLWKRIGDMFRSFMSTIEGTVGVAFLNFLRTALPQPLHFLIPFLQDDLGIKPPSIRRLVGVGVPEQKEAQTILEQVVVDARSAQLWQIKPQFTRYRCIANNPFRCQFPQEAIALDPNNRYCPKCQFPALLPPEVKIRGQAGIYQIERYLGCRGLGRLYEAVNINDGQTVILKEYIIPNRDFNSEETRLTKESFLRLAGVALADGRPQNFRLVLPHDAIADPREERCYLVFQGRIASATTLADHLAVNGAMDSWQVRDFLFQVLQVLESIHTQKYRLSSGMIQHQMPHGNLSLYSLLITENLQGFHIYVCDLGLWEHRFCSPLVPPPEYSIAGDLQDLGYIAFYLLAGGIVDLEKGYALDPNHQDHWRRDVHPALKDYLYNLIGIGSVSYETAETARRALVRLPMHREIASVAFVATAPAPPKKQRQWLRPLIAWLAVILGILLALWLFLPALFSTRPTREVFPCCLAQVSGIPEGQFNYTAEREGTWSYVLQQENLIARGTTLEAELRKSQPKLQLNFQAVPSFSAAIALVQADRAAFAISSLLNNVSSDLTFRPFAYDGLAVFVAFSYARRDNSLPSALGGQISFEQLRRLYTGEVRNWRELGGPDLAVRLYAPLDTESVQIFEQRVLRTDAAIAQFRQLLSQGGETGVTALPTFETLRQAIRDFEERNVGAVSFASISRVFGQCSVYPLAIKESDQPASAPLITRDKKAVTPTTDLCNEKGNYTPDYEAFVSGRYPLSYPIAVVYPLDNRRIPVGDRFAAMMTTTEAQKLLQRTGLIPLQVPSS